MGRRCLIHACIAAAAAYMDDNFTAGCPQRSTSTLTTPGVGTAAQPRPYRPGYLTPNDANPGPALIQSLSGFDPFNYYTLSPTFQRMISGPFSKRPAPCCPCDNLAPHGARVHKPCMHGCFMILLPNKGAAHMPAVSHARQNVGQMRVMTGTTHCHAACTSSKGHMHVPQADGNTTGASAAQLAANPKGYCYAEQPPWSAYRESRCALATTQPFHAAEPLVHQIGMQLHSRFTPIQLLLIRCARCAASATAPWTSSTPRTRCGSGTATRCATCTGTQHCEPIPLPAAQPPSAAER